MDSAVDFECNLAQDISTDDVWWGRGNSVNLGSMMEIHTRIADIMNVEDIP